MKYLGCAYYPEYWGPERVDIDAKLMRQASINCVRIGEFAWSRMEPAEGIYALDWLHQAVEKLGKHGIDVVMCTPSATPPAWLTEAYPDVLLVRADKGKLRHGTRRHYCSTSDTYRRHCARIAGVLSREMSRHKNVVAWQIDNELGPETGWCYCENCQSRFQQWLQTRYGTIEELNGRWGTGFWSMDYSNWRQVRLGEDAADHFSSRRLDTKRFLSDMMIDFGLAQAEVLRKNHPKATITTNGMGPIFMPLDYYKLYAGLDVACDDLYFDTSTMDANAAAMNVFRSYKPGKGFWITETGSGALTHEKPPHRDQLRAWAWSGIAHGADGWWIFRWRTCLSGQEQELQGMLEHSGRPRHRYEAVKAMFGEIAKLRPQLAKLPLPEAPVAIVADYNVLWGYQASRVDKEAMFHQHILKIHECFYDRNIVADIINFDHDLDGYKLVVLPTAVMIPKEFASRLSNFVRRGGVVLATGQLGMRDFNDNYLLERGPEHLQELFGVLIEGGMYLRSHVGPDEALWVPAPKPRQIAVPIVGKLGGDELAGSANVWIADLTLNGGEMLASFDGEAYAGQSAVVERRTGKGRCIYAAALGMNAELLIQLVEYASSLAKVESRPGPEKYVEIIRRGGVIFAINHTNSEVTVEMGKSAKAMVGTCEQGTARLGPYGVCVARG